MPAYIIAEITITNPLEYEEYKKLTPATIEAYGGTFLARGGETEILEGNLDHNRIVILQFPSTKKAKEWWNSMEYEPAKKIRHRAANSKMILVEGISNI